MAEVKKAKLSEKTHPLYDENIDKWELCYDSVMGGKNFINTDNLFSHRLEDSEDYTEREERAYFLNYCDAVPTIYNDFIFRENIERPPDKLLSGFRNDADRRGTTLSDFVRKAGFFATVYGVIHALLDIPSTKNRSPLSLAQAKSDKIQPYATLIYPEQLVDWSVDAEGNFRWILIESIYYRDDDPAIERQSETHYKLITREEWRVEDEDGNPVQYPEEGRESSGSNPWGIIPMVTMYHKDIEDNKVGESILKDIVYVNRAILNWCSCMDEQIERQTFSQLVVPDDGNLAEQDEAGDDPLYKISTTSVWTANAEAKWPPQFISPDVENIYVIWRIIVDHIKEIWRMAGLIGSSDDMYVSRSGRAAQIGFTGVNSSLANKSKRYEKFENNLSRMVYHMINQDPSNFEESKYPDSFDVAALVDQLDSYLKVMERNFSPTLNKTLMKNIARRAVPLATESIRSLIEDEIEAQDGIVESLTQKEESDNTGEDGNPNFKGGETTRTKGELEEEETKKQKKEE